MRSTGKFTAKGEEIFEGDYVMMAWGMSTYQKQRVTHYKIHQITVRPAHMMANNQMHDDGGGIIFCLGECYNFWDGKDVCKITLDEVEEVKNAGILPDQTFILINDRPVLFTNQHFMDMDDAAYSEFKKEEDKRMADFWYGKN